MRHLQDYSERILAALDVKNAAREKALERSRRLVRHAANAIQATHRQDWDEAADYLKQAEVVALDLRADLEGHADLYYAGYTQDGLKELAEAHITRALVSDQGLPDPDELGIEYPAYLNGLGEAMGELRRHLLDLIRRGDMDRAEDVLGMMEEVYLTLVAVDYPSAITGNLRRTTDMVRGVLERSRGDLTIARRQQQLERALSDLERRLE